MSRKGAEGHTPLIAQFLEIKSRYPEAILFFRVGDFYEMFFDDAKIAAQELQIALTSRGRDPEGNPIPLAGVPYHSYHSYLATLLKRGYRVALCEQTSDPKTSKGLVDREVVRVFTPGTVVEDGLLEGREPNHLVAVHVEGGEWCMCWCDVSTGETGVFVSSSSDAVQRLSEELARLHPAELLTTMERGSCPELEKALDSCGLGDAARHWGLRLPHNARSIPLRHFGELHPRMEESQAVLKTLGLLLSYIGSTYGEELDHLEKPKLCLPEHMMKLDPATIRNLELTETIVSRSREGSLLWLLDSCSTTMGSRMLKHWMLHPLIDRKTIEQRLDRVERLTGRPVERNELKRLLRRVYDLPRICSRIASQRANARDLAALAASAEAFPAIKETLEEIGLEELSDAIIPSHPLLEETAKAIVESPPDSITEGGIIRGGYDRKLDELRSMAKDAKTWIARFEEKERERTGIKSLKVRFNKVFGYYIEVTRPNLHLVPAEYKRKQTIATGERFVTPYLQEKERELLSAEEKSRRMEYELFCDLRARLKKLIPMLQHVGAVLAEIDVLASLAEVSDERGYTRPVFTDEDLLEIEGGRHPVIEARMPKGSFVPNDLHLDAKSARIVILTGPNMSGKSTYLRQTALICLMAQMGCFVPASRCTLSPLDNIFTRVGASDDIGRGQSTFMVEMHETAYILRNVTSRSLVLLDEIGRGTSTYDGVSIAWAIVHHLATVPSRRAKVLFATHYHELTELAQLYEGVVNRCVSVKEQGDEVIFLHRIKEGAADKSYGIHVARLAGFPESVLDKAREVLFELEKKENADLERHKSGTQLQLFMPIEERSEVEEKLLSLDPDNLTPLQALNILAKLRRTVEEKKRKTTK